MSEDTKPTTTAAVDKKPKLAKLPPRGRAHPNVVALDALVLNYSGWKNDKREAENAAYYDDSTTFQGCMTKMKRKQKVFDGDRSHPQLQQLDSMKLSYDGWHRDKGFAESDHVQGQDASFRCRLEQMNRKQKMQDEDRTDPELQALYSLTLTYSGWENDVSGAKYAYAYGTIRHYFDIMERKQKIHEGKISVPPLPTAISSTKWTYEGWESDKASCAERARMDTPSSLDSLLESMRSKQKIHDDMNGKRSHTRLVALDAPQWCYPGWETDKATAEQYHAKDWECMFDPLLTKMKRKQQIHGKDNSEPQLEALGALTLTYPGWERDFAGAENAYIIASSIETNLQAMKGKQKAHEGSAMCPILLLEDDEVPSHNDGDATRPVVLLGEDASGASTGASARQDGSASDPVILEDEQNIAPTGVGARPRRRGAKKRNRRGKTTTRNPMVDTSGKCVICLVKDRTHSFQPCGHFCVCEGCKSSCLDRAQCPIYGCPAKIVSADPHEQDQESQSMLVALT